MRSRAARRTRALIEANPSYKTSLCAKFSWNGECRYGDKCQYAHGVHELRVAEEHEKYKTSVCRTFLKTGQCEYGLRCKFIHEYKHSTMECVDRLPVFRVLCVAIEA